jgi:hypothetical protein
MRRGKNADLNRRAAALTPPRIGHLIPFMTHRRCSGAVAMTVGLVTFAVLLPLFPIRAVGEEHSGDEHAVIVEIGAAGEHELSDGGTDFGPAVGLEVEPIEGWLESSWAPPGSEIAARPFGISTSHSRSLGGYRRTWS